MKYIKQYAAFMIGLVIIDQLVKIIIYNFFFIKNIDILDNIIRFHPKFNTNLSWGGNYISLFSNMSFAVIANVIVIALFISGYAYYRSKNSSAGFVGNLIYIFGLAGAVCSFVDKIIWGGSLDFIQIPHLFTFDLKDCYLTVAECLFLFVGIKHSNEISFTDYIKWCLSRIKPMK